MFEKCDLKIITVSEIQEGTLYAGQLQKDSRNEATVFTHLMPWIVQWQ